MPRPKHDWVLLPFAGETIRLDASDLIGYHFCQLGSFDPEVTDVLVAFASGEDLLWDIGANCGTTCYTMLGRLSTLSIVAVEPQPALAELLKENLKAVAPGLIQIAPVALGEKNEELELVVPHGNGGRGSLVVRDDSAAVASRHLVRVVTADQLRKDTNGRWPTLIKIDVEGFEPAVVRGLAPALASRIPRAVVFEHHGGRDDAFEDMRLQFHEQGYVVLAISKSVFATYVEHLTDGGAGATDYVALRDDLCPRGDPGRRLSLRHTRKNTRSGHR